MLWVGSDVINTLSIVGIAVAAETSCKYRTRRIVDIDCVKPTATLPRTNDVSIARSFIDDNIVRLSKGNSGTRTVKISGIRPSLRGSLTIKLN